MLRSLALSLVGLLLLPDPAVSACVGDCDGSGTVEVNEIVRGVNIALDAAELSTCVAMDANGDGRITVNELVTAVNLALTGCPLATATPTPSLSPTPAPSPSPTPNPPPVLPEAEVYRGRVGKPIAWPLGAYDPDGGTVRCALEGAPEGLALTGEPDRLEWTPAIGQSGVFVVGVRCRGGREPAAEIVGQRRLWIEEPSPCEVATCDPGIGCTTEPVDVEVSCCDEIGAERQAPDISCPEGAFLEVLEIEEGGLRPLRECEEKLVLNFAQSTAAVRLGLRARCLSLDDRVRTRIRIETSGRVPMAEREVLVPFQAVTGGWAESPPISVEVNPPRPFFDIEGQEGNLDVTLRDARNLRVTRSIRLRFTFGGDL